MPSGTYLALKCRMDNGTEKTYTFSYLSNSAYDSQIKTFIQQFLNAHDAFIGGILVTGPEEGVTSLIEAVRYSTIASPVMM